MRCGPFIAGEFGGRSAASRKVEHIVRMRRKVQVTMEPPLLKRHVLKGGDRAVVVRKHLMGDIEAPHGWVEEGWKRKG